MHDELAPTDLIQRIPYFALLPADASAELLGAWKRCTFGAGTMIFLEGAPTAGLYAVAAGQVRIFKLSPEGREQGLHLAGPGSTFNDVSALDGGPNPASTLALAETVLYHLERETLLDLMARHPVLSHALAEYFAARVRLLVGKVEALAFYSVATRLARLLLEQAALDEPVLPRQRWLTQQEMAVQLGTAREVVGRLLRSFAARNLITFDRHQIRLIDREALEHIAAGL